MLYNQNIGYSQQNYSYTGTLIIKAPSLSSPIILNNIAILISGSEDYSNYTTIAIVSMDISPTGIVSLEVLDENVSAIVSAQSIVIQNGEISIVS